jgi:hypothetical protein
MAPIVSTDKAETFQNSFRLTLTLMSCMPTAILYTIALAVGGWYDESLFEELPSWSMLEEIVGVMYGWSSFYVSALVAVLIGGVVRLLDGHARTIPAMIAGAVGGSSCFLLWTIFQPSLPDQAMLYSAISDTGTLMPPVDYLFFLPQFQLLLIYYAVLYGVVQEIALRLHGVRPGPWAAATALGSVAGGCAVLWLPVPDMRVLLPPLVLAASLGAGIFQFGLIWLRYKQLVLSWMGESLRIGSVASVSAVLLILPSGPFVAWLPGLLCGILTANAWIQRFPVDADREGTTGASLGWFILFSVPAIIASVPLVGRFALFVLFRIEDDLVIPAVLVGTFLLALSLIIGGLLAVQGLSSATVSQSAQGTLPSSAIAMKK